MLLVEKTRIRLRRTIIGLCSLLCVLIALSCILFFVATETKPRPITNTSLSESDAKLATTFLKRVSKQIINSHKTVTIYATQDELNSALTLINNTYSGIAGQVNVVANDADFYLSLRFSLLSKTYYLNSQARLITAADGIHWQNGQIGDLRLNNTFSDFFFHRFIEVMIGRNYGQDILQGITAVEIETQVLRFNFTPAPSFHKGFADAVKRFTAYSGESVAFDSNRVQYYVDFLVDLTRTLPKQEVSLSHYLHKIITEAKTQCINHKLQAQEENTAALYAIAIVVAPGTFRHFVSDLKVHRLNATNQPQLTISGRQDLAKHFVYSAALKILSSKGISFSLGEMKEIVDSASGGSGFSFADLAADKSGIKFADFALGKHEHAVLLQNRVALSLKETDFFPPIKNLPEGLDKQQFLTQYDTTHSERYQKLVARIDTEINAAALYE